MNGEQARDAALEAVERAASEEWKTLYMGYVISLPEGWCGTGEDIRMEVSKFGEPHSPNAWGAMTNVAQQAGYLKDTGRMVKMKQTGSHARRTPVWTRTNRRPQCTE